MESRRKFLKQAGMGFALSTMPFSVNKLYPGNFQSNEDTGKSLVIGIIGAENSHTIGFGKMFNINKDFPGVELRYVWGETEEFAKRASENGAIPHIVKDPKDMLGKIDALIVDHRHAKYHLEAARPFVEAGIPSFIDKPFCYRVEEGKEFLAMAKAKGTPVASYSSVAHSYATFDIIEKVKAMGEISQIIATGPGDFDSKYGGIFFYGIHMVQPMMYIFGDDITKVRVTRAGKNDTASLVFADGKLLTLIIKKLSYGWNTFVETKDGMVELKSDLDEPKVEKCYVDMVEMFKTGKEPISHDSILKSVAVLEALEKSGLTGEWTDVVV